MTIFSYPSQDSIAGSEFEVAEQLINSDYPQRHGSELPEPHLWGYLQHSSGHLTRVDFWKVCPEYTFGRDEDNTIVLSSPTISSLHCTITWNGKEDNTSTVTIHDNSSNGTYINGKKIGKGNSSLLRDGNEIAFGTCIAQDYNRAQDYRFIFRHVANGKALEGLYDFYDISHEIGSGSFGTVTKAISRHTGEWYAVKTMKKRPTFTVNRTKGKAKATEEKSETSFKALAREVSILARLTHPNICQLKEVFISESRQMQLVLEYVDGGDLLDYVINNNGIDEEETRHITYQICAALDYIHGKGIVHRDLKPENILLTSHTPPVVKVADFGLSKAVDHMTILRTQCGTPAYMAPEVMKEENEEGYDHLADSWSLGVMVFCMLTAKSPFAANSEYLSRTAERLVEWSTLDNADVSEEAKDFIRCLLQEDPHDRFSMKDALSHPWLAKIKGRTYKFTSMKT